MNILVYGSLAYDQIMDFNDAFDNHILPDEIKKLNVSFVVKEFKETFGGTAGNICYNLALLKEKSNLYGSAGSNFDKYKSRLSKLGVDCSGVTIYNKTLTATAYIITDKNNNQITGFFPGALNFKTKLPKVKKDDIAIVAPADPNQMLDLAEFYFNKKIFFIFDPGQQIIQFTKRQLLKAVKLASIYIVNDYELALTKKITGHSKEDILNRAGILITTVGSKGSIIDLSIDNKIKRVKIKPVQSKLIKDPTGAGDAYRAGLIKGLIDFKEDDLYKMPWWKIGEIATLCATYAAENYGTQNHKYTFADFKKRYLREFKNKL